MPKVVNRGTPDGLLHTGKPSPARAKGGARALPPAKASSSKKRSRPSARAPPPYPPPPPPPPPPANNPYYKKFFEDYWKQHASGYNVPHSVPPPPPGAPLVKLPAMTAPLAGPTVVPLPAVPGVPATRDGSLPTEEYPAKDDRVTYVVATPDDPDYLSEKQCYVRTRLMELFVATQEDVDKKTRNRKASFVGQVGIRCVYCVPAMEPKHRVERAICYPTTVKKLYQTGQDMQHFHFATCPAIPPAVKLAYQDLRSTMNHRRSVREIAPRDYWTKSCEDLGMIDHIGDDGTNAGVKLSGDHKFVERSRMRTEYAEALFMPPSSKGGEDGMDEDEDGKMERALAEEVDGSGGGGGGFDELVADLDKGGGEEEEEEDEEGGGGDDDEEEEEEAADDDDGEESC